MTLTELKAAWDAAWQVHDELKTRRRALERERREEFERQLQRELDGMFGGPLGMAANKLEAAKRTYYRALEAEALAKPREIPIGTVMEEWKFPRHSYGRGPRLKTGRRGLLEVVTSISEFPDRGYPPEIGAEIIRLFRKDGSPSKLYVSGWAVSNEWRPVQGEEVDMK